MTTLLFRSERAYIAIYLTLVQHGILTLLWIIMGGWLVGWLVDWLVGWRLVDWLVDWLVG